MRNDRDWHLAEAERLLERAADERDTVRVSLLVSRAAEHRRLARDAYPATGGR